MWFHFTLNVGDLQQEHYEERQLYQPLAGLFLFEMLFTASTPEACFDFCPTVEKRLRHFLVFNLSTASEETKCTFLLGLLG